MTVCFLYDCTCSSLDLDAWINEPPSESESEDEKPRTMFTKEETKYSRPRHTEVDEKELAKVTPNVISMLQVLSWPHRGRPLSSLS